MSDLLRLSDEQMARLETFSPKPASMTGAYSLHQSQWLAVPRCSERIWSTQGPLQPLETLERQGCFAQMMAGLSAEHGEKKTVMTDATCLKAIARHPVPDGRAWAPDRAHRGAGTQG